VYGTVAAKARTPRSSWIEAGLRALAAGGPDAVRVESLAQTLGVTKGGFYWHFADRGALLEEMLDRWEQVMVDAVIERVDAGAGDARARLRRLFRLAASVEKLLDVELAIRDWARRDPGVAERVRRVDNRRMSYLRQLFGALYDDPADVEVRCLLVMSLFIGNHFIAAGHGGRTRSAVLKDAVRWLDSSPPMARGSAGSRR
jgi:AcrR family transcriptional regulator